MLALPDVLLFYLLISAICCCRGITFLVVAHTHTHTHTQINPPPPPHTHSLFDLVITPTLLITFLKCTICPRLSAYHCLSYPLSCALFFPPFICSAHFCRCMSVWCVCVYVCDPADFDILLNSIKLGIALEMPWTFPVGNKVTSYVLLRAQKMSKPVQRQPQVPVEWSRNVLVVQ